jgi:hypothetical protein
MVMEWYWIEMIFGIAVWSNVIYSNPILDHTLCKLNLMGTFSLQL